MDCCERFLSKWVPSWKRVHIYPPYRHFWVDDLPFFQVGYVIRSLQSTHPLQIFWCSDADSSHPFLLLEDIHKADSSNGGFFRLRCRKCVPNNKYLQLSKTKGTLIASEKSTKAMMICPALEASVRFSDLFFVGFCWLGWGQVLPPKTNGWNPGTWKSSRKWTGKSSEPNHHF